jgi:hypothetical protein
MAQAFDPIYVRGKGRRIALRGWHQAKIEFMPSKCKALSLNHSTTKRKKS